jgi:threonine/homoserine/homoserine lactone efflux protein
MTVAHALIAFTAAAALLTITPGLDTALVLRTAAVEGPRRATFAGVGICLGCLTWGIAVAAGLGALFAISHFAYNVLRILGGAYLIYLGCKVFFQPSAFAIQTALSPGAIKTGRASLVGNAWHWLPRGFFTNILNPKVGVFYVTFLPQFIPAGVNVASFSVLLAAIHATEGILWFVALIFATHRLSDWLRRPPVAKALNRGTGAVLMGFGLELLLEHHR